jgi:hypothetical protein
MASDERLSGIVPCKDQISFSSLMLAWLAWPTMICS